MRFTKACKDKANKYVRDNVVDTNTLKAVEELEVKLASKIALELTLKYPQDDMIILSRYGHSSNVCEIIFSMRNVKDAKINLKQAQKSVLIPSRYPDEHRRYTVEPHTFSGVIRAEIDTYKNLWEKHQAANTAMQEKYAVLFESCTNFKQLLEYWPECILVFPSCMDKQQTSLIALSQTDLAWIKKDSLTRIEGKQHE